METIYLAESQIDQLTTIAKDNLPNESCAFLIGRNEKVVVVLPMRNADNSPITFSIDPVELLHAYKLAEEKDMEVIAIFHSHPGKPFPSRTDRKFMEINPVVWIIYSTTEKRLGGFIFHDDGYNHIRNVDIRISSTA
jgi:[CysO sulfur-carrier protein]-S-L-cysteine hydrolase